MGVIKKLVKIIKISKNQNFINIFHLKIIKIKENLITSCYANYLYFYSLYIKIILLIIFFSIFTAIYDNMVIPAFCGKKEVIKISCNALKQEYRIALQNKDKIEILRLLGNNTFDNRIIAGEPGNILGNIVGNKSWFSEEQKTSVAFKFLHSRSGCDVVSETYLKIRAVLDSKHPCFPIGLWGQKNYGDIVLPLNDSGIQTVSCKAIQTKSLVNWGKYLHDAEKASYVHFLSGLDLETNNALELFIKSREGANIISFNSLTTTDVLEFIDIMESSFRNTKEYTEYINEEIIKVLLQNAKKI